MKVLRSTLLALTALTLVGCADEDGALAPVTLPPLAFVRYINALPDTLSTTVRFIDQVEFSPQTFVNVPYRGLGQGGYQGTQAGSRQFRVFTFRNDVSVAGNTTMLADVTQTFEAGKYYTVLFNGFARPGASPAAAIQILDDGVPDPGTSIALRAIHAAAGVGNVDIYLTPAITSPITGAPAIAGLAYGAASGYATLTPGAFATRITAAGSTTPLINATAPAGVVGTTSVDPITGATIPGSVLTAVAYGASVAGSLASSAANPSVIFYGDRRPPRTTSP